MKSVIFKLIIILIISIILISCDTPTDDAGDGGDDPEIYTLTTNVTGNGYITLDPSDGTYEEGTTVTITAVPDSNWEFDSWSGDLTGSNNPETITMDSDKVITANFNINQFTLTTNVTGNGSIDLDPAGGIYDYGTTVTVTAYADNGWAFDSWSGDLTGSTNPEIIIIDSNKSITANFSINQYNLTTNVTGSGNITLDPVGGTYDYGTTVTVTANADTGWAFDSWSGDLTGSNNPETITMDGDKDITAIFNINQFNLTTNVTGNGSIDLDPAGGTYDYGSTVTVTANADTGGVFDSWAGDLTGSTNPETITMDGDKSITAVFVQPDINVKQNTTNLPDGSGVYNYGEVDENTSTSAITFTIENTGNADLIINDVSIDDTTNFTLTDNTSSPVIGGDSTSFDITFNPQSYGNYSTTVTIDNNDPDENPYTFTITGTGLNVWTNTHTLTGHTDDVISADFNHDSTQIVSGGYDDTIRVWDFNGTSWTNTHTLTGHTNVVRSVSFNGDGTQILSCSIDGTIRLWDFDGSSWTNTHTLTDHTSYVWSAVYNHDYTQIASGSADSTLRVWDFDGSSWTNTHTLTGHTDDVKSVDFSQDGTQIISGSLDFDIRVWDFDGSSWNNTDVLVYHNLGILCVSYNHDSTKIVSGGSESFFVIWEFNGTSWNQEYDGLPGSGYLTSLIFNSDGTGIVLSSYYDNDVQIWDFDGSSWTNTHTLTGHTDGVQCVSYNHDYTQIVSCSDDDTILIWE